MSAQRRPLAPPICMLALEPVPWEGCDVCGALGEQREAARKVFDWTALKSCNAEIASHPHTEGARR